MSAALVSKRLNRGWSIMSYAYPSTKMYLCTQCEVSEGLHVGRVAAEGHHRLRGVGFSPIVGLLPPCFKLASSLVA